MRRKIRMLLNQGSEGGAAWVPTDIAGCVLWLRADTIAGLSNGDPVGTWSDESGLDHHVTQATEAFKPTYWTGPPAVRWNNSNSVLVGAFGDNAPWTAFMVYKYSGVPNPGYLNLINSSTCFGGYNGQSIGLSNLIWNPHSINDAAYHILGFGMNGASSWLRDNQVAYSGTATNMNLASFILGNNSASSPVRGCSGDIREVIMYGDILLSGNIALVETYLKDKYGL